MVKNVLIRFQRYFKRQGFVGGMSPVWASLLAIYYRPQDWFIYPLVSMGLFLGSYPFRNLLIKQIEKPLMHFLDTRFLEVGIVLILMLIFTANRAWTNFVLVGLCATYFGIQFWTRTDELYAMVCWLAHPLEYGKPPDDISLLCTRKVIWGDVHDTCYLFKFRYGDEVSAGITRPIAFSLMEPIGERSPDEIIEQYRLWYQSEGLKVIERDARGTESSG